MSFTRTAFFPGSARAAGPAEYTRENDMTVMTSWDLFDDLRTAQDEMLRTNSPYGHRLTPAGQFTHQYGAGPGAQAWAPPVDITERRMPTWWPWNCRASASRTWRSPSRTAC